MFLDLNFYDLPTKSNKFQIQKLFLNENQNFGSFLPIFDFRADGQNVTRRAELKII